MRRLLLFTLLFAGCGSEDTILARIPPEATDASTPCTSTSECPAGSRCVLGDGGAGACARCVKGEPGCPPVTSW